MAAALSPMAAALLPMAAALLLLAAAGCTAGYETETSRGERLKEWFLPGPRGEGRIEAMAIWPAKEGPHPGLLLLHPASRRAQRFRRAMFSLARQGVVLMSISLPGFGATVGPEDYAGPRTVRAVLRAVAFLRAQPRVREDTIGIFGIGVGATAAALAAAQEPGKIHLLALQGGVYDLPAAYKQLSPARQERLKAILGGAPTARPKAFRARSPLNVIHRFRGEVLIFHARKSRLYPFSEAQALAARLRETGQKFTLREISRSEESGSRNKTLGKWVIPALKALAPARER